MKRLFMHFSAASCHCHSLNSKYSPNRTVKSHTLRMKYEYSRRTLSLEITVATLHSSQQLSEAWLGGGGGVLHSLTHTITPSLPSYDLCEAKRRQSRVHLPEESSTVIHLIQNEIWQQWMQLVIVFSLPSLIL